MGWDLRRQCETTVRTLDQRIGGIPVPFDLNVLLDLLEAARGRPIELIPFSATVSGKLCGIWVGTDRLDLIYYEEATSLLHQDHIILHEIGHMVCEHTGVAMSTTDQVRSLLLTDAVRGQVDTVLGRGSHTAVRGQVDTVLGRGSHTAVRGQVDTVLGRGSYTAVQEQEAELVATLIMERATRPALRLRAVAPSSPQVTAAQRRIEEVWGRSPTRHWS
jgi:hypothetical protein